MRQELREWLEELACRAGLDGLPPTVRTAALVAGAALVVLAVWWWGRPAGGPTPVRTMTGAPVSGEATAADVARPSVPTSVTVHVVGAVMRPGVYCLRAGSRASDAVAAAGGLLGNAEQSGINLARQVADGEQLVVPVQGAGPAIAAGGPAGGKPAGGSVDLNTADAAELDTLPGVGPATAAKIIADRTENGPFRTIEDLMRVPGIGAGRFESLKDLVVVR